MGIFDNLKEIASLSSAVKQKKTLLQSLNDQQKNAEVRYSEIQGKIANSQVEYDKIIAEANITAQRTVSQLTSEANSKRTAIENLNIKIKELQDMIIQQESRSAEVEKKIENQKKRIIRANTIIKSITSANERFSSLGSDGSELSLSAELIQLEPTIQIKTHGQNLKDIRRQINENRKQSDDLLKTYKARYTTKSNLTIYSLLVIALRAELQNALYNLRFEKLDKAISSIKEMTKKYLTIVTDGNQSIAPTITRFIGQLEYFFIEAVTIEYEYYIKQEQIKDEQRAIREQMRQEAEERRILEQQRKQLEAEENKYLAEIKNVEAQMEAADTDTKRMACEQRLASLNVMIGDLEGKKEEIIKLQNGQAGYIYIISNLGSFGEQMFKIGMTRRQQPVDRINELGDASVPFSFDIHAMIFSDNAVTLENRLHKRFEDNRVNKINRRREFFYTTIDDLQICVNELEPSAEFDTTMLAEQYRQTLAINEGIIDLTDVIEETDDADDSESEESNA